VSHNDPALRIETLLAGPALGSAQVDAFLVTGLPNIRYLSGFTGSNAILLLTRASSTLFTDPRYQIQARQQVPFPVRIGKRDVLPLALESIRKRGLKRVGVERNRLTFETWEVLRNSLSKEYSIVPIDAAVEKLRMVKSEDEIAAIRGSVETNSRAFRRALRGFRHGMRERELAAELDYQARRAGAEGPAFETIVAFGARTALPHARPTDDKIRDKGLLLIDMGSFQDGYASDMTRTLHLGNAPKRVKSIYRAVLEAQLSAIDAVRPGVEAGDVDHAARKVLKAAGLGPSFVHSTGHGLGLEIHESPRIGLGAETVLSPGMVITIEPGAYIPDFGGVRIEDTVVVTEKGCHILTPTPKDLIEW